jgi:hypothetical protein
MLHARLILDEIRRIFTLAIIQNKKYLMFFNHIVSKVFVRAASGSAKVLKYLLYDLRNCRCRQNTPERGAWFADPQIADILSGLVLGNGFSVPSKTDRCVAGGAS